MVSHKRILLAFMVVLSATLLASCADLREFDKNVRAAHKLCDAACELACVCEDVETSGDGDDYVCSCPDPGSTFSVSVDDLSFEGVDFFSNGGSSSSSVCVGDRFFCDNGNDVSCSWRCDGDNDCGDLSDERSSVCP